MLVPANRFGVIGVSWKGKLSTFAYRQKNVFRTLVCCIHYGNSPAAICAYIDYSNLMLVLLYASKHVVHESDRRLSA